MNARRSRLELRFFDRSIGIDREMEHDGRRFVRAARAAGKQDPPEMRHMFAAHEELAEGRVPFILQRRRERDLAIAGEAQRTGTAAFIGNDEATYFDIVAGGDAGFHAQLDPDVASVELGKMWMEDHAIFVGSGAVGCRVPTRIAVLFIRDIDPEPSASRVVSGRKRVSAFRASATAAATLGNPARKSPIAKQKNLRERRRDG